MPSTKKTCPTSEKKKTMDKTDCNGNTKQKECPKIEKSNHKVCENMFPHAAQLLLSLSYLWMKYQKNDKKVSPKIPMYIFIDKHWLTLFYILSWDREVKTSLS